ncbi:hypothetical protein LZ023_23155 [Pseudomonas silvicola]|nr:hypothetical protein LZ023_23155 [Pseudomonas silvicola]
MMESLDRSSAVIELGRLLVKQLNLGDDLMAQWLAHLVAERMAEAESAVGDERVAAQAKCQQMILTLWEYRNSFPSEQRPFNGLEPLMATLQSLDISSEQRFRYFRRHPTPGELDEVGTGKELLDAAASLDKAARVLIHQLLGDAAKVAAVQAKPWIEAAGQAGADAAAELAVLEFVLSDDEALDGNEQQRPTITQKVAALEVFIELAAIAAAEYRALLATPR